MRILVSDPVAQMGINILKEAAEVDVRVGLSPAELKDIIGQYDALVVRSETKVTAEIIEAASNLKVVARAGAGVDNIDVDAATERGVLVVNTPGGNTISAAEHTMGMLLALARNIPQADASLRAGRWDRKSFMGVELFRKTLGVIGLGRIGTEVAKRARSFGMEVITYDLQLAPKTLEQLGAVTVSLNELLERSDFITIHAPLNRETEHMIGAAEIARMKDGVRIINCARGGIVDESALYEGLRSGKVGGAALDVFEKEPAVGNPLLDLPSVVATPHLGASSREAQANVSIGAAESVLTALGGGLVENAVNMPAIPRDILDLISPYLELAEQMGKMLGGIAAGPIETVESALIGDLPDIASGLCAAAAAKGLLERIVQEPVTLINSRSAATRWGVEIVERLPEKGESGAPAVLDLLGRSSDGTVSLKGMVTHEGQPRVISIDDGQVNVEPWGYLLIASYTDRPGMIGKIGTILGSHEINIAGMQVGRESPGGTAVMVLTVDNSVPDHVVALVRRVEGVSNLRFVDLGTR